MKKLFFAIVFSAILVAANFAQVAAQTVNELRIPEEVKPFVPKGTAAIALRSGDLNGDGTLDFILVLNKPSVDSEYSDHELDQRPTLLIVSDRAGKLRVAARNDSIVTCSNCDAPFTNPYGGIAIGKNNFTIEVEMGSQFHITDKMTFAYSPRDKDWLLTRVVETDLDIYKDTSTTLVYTTPRNFDKTTFVDFSFDFSSKGTPQKAAPVKTRGVTIYVYGEFDADKGRHKIVPVYREIVDYRPLDQALKLLTEGTTEDERNRGLSDLVLDLKFHSARVRQKTAQINLKLNAKYEENLEEAWEGGGFHYDQFVEAVELTARQFPGIEKVSICINGIENYTDFGRTKKIKCSFPLFPPAKLPKQPN